MKYLQSFLSKKCAEDVIRLFGGVNNPVKEITESYAAWTHLRSLSEVFDGKRFIHIGDGSRCLTAALFTFLCPRGVHNISIDPNVNTDIVCDWVADKNVKDFTYVKAPFQVVAQDSDMDDLTKSDDPYVIVLVHAHVDIKEVDKYFPNWKYMYINPCCMRDKQVFDFNYLSGNGISVVKFGWDSNILSDKNEVIIYRKEIYG